MQQQKVVIIGGGFAGIRTALDLVKTGTCEVVLISQNPNFEYYPGLHKMIGIHDSVVVQVPLATIFEGKSISLVYEKVIGVDIHTKTVTTEHAPYQADYVILAMGSQTEYFGIAGLPEMAFGFKSVAEARKLRNHIEDMFAKHVKTDKAESVVGLHMVIVGAGPNGVDLAGEIAALNKSLAKKYGVIESLITVDLIEAASRVLAMLPEPVSHRVEKRLRDLGVTVLCNRDLKRQESWTVELADMTMGAKTVVWTAGIITNELVKKIEGLTLMKKNRVAVDEFLQVKGAQNIFCVGDVADTPYAGLAQTALYDGEYVASVIMNKISGQKFHAYTPKPNAFNIGVGPMWSVMQVGSFVSYGFFPYVFRSLIDIKFFLSILPVKQVWKLFFKKAS
ncbi:MAG: FAD-dependent oxidoreductase [bacterium]